MYHRRHRGRATIHINVGLLFLFTFYDSLRHVHRGDTNSIAGAGESASNSALPQAGATTTQTQQSLVVPNICVCHAFLLLRISFRKMHAFLPAMVYLQFHQRTLGKCNTIV